MIDKKNDNVYRPYDLRVIKDGKNSKEHTLLEYYTISALGIVHLYTEKVYYNKQREKNYHKLTVQPVL